MERVVPCVIDYRPRRHFTPFHARWHRFACIVTRRRASKTVTRIHEGAVHAGGDNQPQLAALAASAVPSARADESAGASARRQQAK
jgi:hypothetical protein